MSRAGSFSFLGVGALRSWAKGSVPLPSPTEPRAHRQPSLALPSTDCEREVLIGPSCGGKRCWR